MTQLIAIVVAIGSFIYSFFQPIWAWIPLSAAGLLLLIILFSIKLKKWQYVDELSSSANEMLQKFGNFYSMPFASRDFSAACSTIQFAAVAVGIVDAFNGFWWGLGLAVIFWFVLGPTAMAYNPTNFIQNEPMLRMAHEEVIEWVMSRTQNEEDSDS